MKLLNPERYGSVWEWHTKDGEPPVRMVLIRETLRTMKFETASWFLTIHDKRKALASGALVQAKETT